MLDNFVLKILVLVLLLVGSRPPCDATSLGLSVHVVPLHNEAGKKVRAHFTAIVPKPCQPLTGVCSESEDCELHKTSTPLSGNKPDPGWCVRQWEKTVPSLWCDTISLGSNTQMFVKIKADPHIRENNKKLNQPPFVALVPPLRASENCLRSFPLSVKDLDGDKVHCRFAQAEKGECVQCEPHSFIQLDEKDCILTFTGKAVAGQYFIYLMAEDRIPTPKQRLEVSQEPLSSVPVHLSLTVESSTSCLTEPVERTPRKQSTRNVLPYEEVNFDLHFSSQHEKIIEFAVVGPHSLLGTGFHSEETEANMALSWVCSENTLPRLLSVCYAANTESLQSVPRCLWLHQRELRTLPLGTELTCKDTEMNLVLPIASLSYVNLAELQLNSQECPIKYNNTHLTARIPFVGCGTKTVASGKELVYTNTLQSVRPWTMVIRQPLFILPLACRIPGALASGPWSYPSMPNEEKIFGKMKIWIEMHLPGEGPFGSFTRTPVFRSIPTRSLRERRETNLIGNKTFRNLPLGSKVNTLDLVIMSDTVTEKAEMIVTECKQALTEDMTETTSLLKDGCLGDGGTLEIMTSKTHCKVYRLDVSHLSAHMQIFVQCSVRLCIPTLPSKKCPDLCTWKEQDSNILENLFTKTYTVQSGAVSLLITTPAPKVEGTVAGASAIKPAGNPTTASIKVEKTTAASSAAERSLLTTFWIILSTVGLGLRWFFFP